MKKISGEAKNIRTLLGGGARFSIDYYQREYRWETKQIIELINDLCGKFMESHDEKHEKNDNRDAVKGYDSYFLGSIIISNKMDEVSGKEKKFIIDGQQRLTSLTLLLIYLRHQIEDEEDRSVLSQLIRSRHIGKTSFNLEVEERESCMASLFNNDGNDIDEGEQPESVSNILRRYRDIKDTFNNFHEDLTDGTLPFFIDWLMENVYLVEITAYSDAAAYTIFETMNDRGLSLTATDMLKGYLLANIIDKNTRDKSSNSWRKQIDILQKLGKEEDADAIKNWLRSQYARNIRERKRGAKPLDFDLIGTEFHRWVRDNQEVLKLRGSEDFAGFIENDFTFYGYWYRRIRQCADIYSEATASRLKAIHYNAGNKFTLQYPVLLAPLVKSDNEEDIIRKLSIVSTYLDILITRRIWNWRSTSYSAMQYTMFQLIKSIRNRSPDDLISILHGYLTDAKEETFKTNEIFHLTKRNGPQVHRILARITDFVKTEGEETGSQYDEYIQPGKNRYEIEHILPNHPKQYESTGFIDTGEFSEYRNRVGGLLLLPKSYNASLSDASYADKLECYSQQNLLARSLHEKSRDNNPRFRRFIEENDLDFDPYPEFGKVELNKRQALYLKLAEIIWDPEKLKEL